MLSHLLRLSLIFLPLSLCASITGRIELNDVLSDPSQLEIDARVMLNGGAAGSTYLLSDGSFVLPHIQPGEYIITIYSHLFHFPSYYLLLPSSEEPQITIYNPSLEAPAQPIHPSLLLPLPLRVRARAPMKYFEDPKTFNLLGMLWGNPMMLLMIGGGAMVFVMPKLMAMMDPESLKEMQENQAEINKNMANMQNIDFTSGLSKFLAGGAEEKGPTIEKGTTATGRKAAGGGGKKRR